MTATSKKIQRYRPRQNPKWGEDLMEEVPNGGYVLESDYVALEQQFSMDSWTAEMQRALEYIPREFVQNDQWENGVKRLADVYKSLEQQALRMAEWIMKRGEWIDGTPGNSRCMICDQRHFNHTKIVHKPDCIVSLSESIIHQHNESEKGNDQKAL